MKAKSFFLLALFIGVASFLFALMTDPSRAWHAFVLNYYVFTCVGIGGIFFAATQHLTNAGWSATVRRIPEAFHAWFPLAVLLILPIIFFGKSIYIWTDPTAVASDPLLKLKTAYLNVPFFLVRATAFFAVWYLLGGKLVRNSLKQDQTGEIALTSQNVKLSAIFMPFFAILFSLLSVDLIMSLDPHWYSTMFGVNCFANLFLSTMAAIVIVVVHMKKRGFFGDTVNENHIQNLGLLMFAFVVFYAYIAFCQFMLIWYANLPEETSFYLKRYEGGWSVIAYSIIFVKFLIPFLLLLPREAKRNMNYVVAMAYWVFIANWIDNFWMIMPDYSPHPFLPLVEVGVFFGFLGAFGLSVWKFLSTHPVQPQSDPRLNEALRLHQ